MSAHDSTVVDNHCPGECGELASACACRDVEAAPSVGVGPGCPTAGTSIARRLAETGLAQGDADLRGQAFDAAQAALAPGERLPDLASVAMSPEADEIDAAAIAGDAMLLGALAERYLRRALSAERERDALAKHLAKHDRGDGHDPKSLDAIQARMIWEGVDLFAHRQHYGGRAGSHIRVIAARLGRRHEREALEALATIADAERDAAKGGAS